MRIVQQSTVARNWAASAAARRRLLATLIIVPAAIAGAFMMQILPHHGASGLEIAIVVIFAILFAWVSFGFWTALAGFILLRTGEDRFAISRTVSADAPAPNHHARTAIVMPICNEDPGRVFAGLATMHQSLADTGSLSLFDFFILSDTADPDKWVKEEMGWAALCESVQGFGRIFYRRRRNRIKRKSGNIADFCRRWGRDYRYMVVLDADSIMAGETFVNLVQMMERNPDVGIIQSPPSTVNRHTLFARVQQFANWVYGPAFSAGLSYWQLGDGHYWGHNAIIRTMPFMRHCMLPKLPGGGPLSGEIMSHDFVEASLMRRAGWKVWLAYDIQGSYEETPPTLLDEMKRDRRWCHGNLQHLRLMFSEGLKPFHRVLFLNGVMSYLSAPLWGLFIVLGIAEVIVAGQTGPQYFASDASLFPQWPVYHPSWAAGLLTATAILLFLPKVFGVMLAHPERHGGWHRLLASVLLENVVSLLLAPTRMVFHSKFVLMTLFGRKVAWNGQSRDDRGTPWGQALRFHGFGMLLGAVATVIVLATVPGYLWWLSPVVIGLLAAVPLSVLSSRESIGRAARKRGLFLTPCELDPPPELARLDGQTELFTQRAERGGFVSAVIDPLVNAVHISLQRPNSKSDGGLRPERMQLRQRLLETGPDGMDAADKTSLLTDPAAMALLHKDVWALSSEELQSKWSAYPAAVPTKPAARQSAA